MGNRYQEVRSTMGKCAAHSTNAGLTPPPNTALQMDKDKLSGLWHSRKPRQLTSAELGR